MYIHSWISLCVYLSWNDDGAHTCSQTSAPGIPLNAITSFGFQVRPFTHEAKVRCNKEAGESVMNISTCTISLSTVIKDKQAGVRCFQSGMTV